MKILKKDIIIVTVLILICSFLSFYNLGTKRIPESYWTSEYTDDAVVVEFKEEIDLKYLVVFYGYGEGKYLVSGSVDGITWEDIRFLEKEYTDMYIWKWEEITPEPDVEITREGVRLKYLKIQASEINTREISIGELIFCDVDSYLIKPKNIDIEAAKLFDEQYTNEDITYKNSIYFDEVYFVRTAYEYLNKLPIYENTHPPLGKLLIASSITIFGTNTWGYRTFGVTAGILIVFLVYIFSKKLFNSIFISTMASLLMMFDFMRFTQSRIATVDTFVTLFVLASFLFMYLYSVYKNKGKKALVFLFLSGAFWGLGCSTKWNAVYSGLGLGMIYFKITYDTFVKLKPTSKNKKTFNKENATKKLLVSDLICGFAFFVIVPVIIYLSTYIPFVNNERNNYNDDSFIRIVIDNQKSMFDYHSTLVDTHPYQSRWYQWVIDSKPIWYAIEYLNDGKVSTIAAFGNPIIWVPGLVSIIFLLRRNLSKKYRDPIASFILIAYFSGFVPYLIISRITFIYHYFPFTPFIVLAIVYVMNILLKKDKKFITGIILYVALAIIVFFIYFPVLSGVPASSDYVEKLRIFRTWIF